MNFYLLFLPPLLSFFTIPVICTQASYFKIGASSGRHGLVSRIANGSQSWSCRGDSIKNDSGLAGRKVWIFLSTGRSCSQNVHSREHLKAHLQGKPPPWRTLWYRLLVKIVTIRGKTGISAHSPLIHATICLPPAVPICFFFPICLSSDPFWMFR